MHSRLECNGFENPQNTSACVLNSRHLRGVSLYARMSAPVPAGSTWPDRFYGATADTCAQWQPRSHPSVTGRADLRSTWPCQASGSDDDAKQIRYRCRRSGPPQSRRQQLELVQQPLRHRASRLSVATTSLTREQRCRRSMNIREPLKVAHDSATSQCSACPTLQHQSGSTTP